MWDIVKELVAILGSVGILVAALTYLAKKLGNRSRPRVANSLQ